MRSGDYEYELMDNGTAMILCYWGKEKDLVIPGDLDGHRVTRIADRAFPDGKHLISVALPEGIEDIGEAFYDCFRMRTLKIPTTLSFDHNPFRGCKYLENLVIPPEHPSLEVTDGVLFDRISRSLLWYPMSAPAPHYSVPAGTASIGGHAFCGSRFLESVSIPGSVKTLRLGAFSECKKLSTVTTEEGLEEIDLFAFFECHALTHLYLPASIRKIHEDAFTIIWFDNECIDDLEQNASDKISVAKISVARGSYAEAFCRENGLGYVVRP